MQNGTDTQNMDIYQAIKIAFSLAGKKLIEHKQKQEEETLNILVCGQTGYGKSTLINAVFGKDFAKTGSGHPVTQCIEKFSENGLTIYDTKGLELQGNQIEDIKNLLEEHKGKEVKDQIHIAWLCIAEPNRRIQEQEKELHNIFKSCKIPTIVTITKAMQDKDDKGKKFSDIVKETLNLNESHLQRVRAIESTIDDEDMTLNIMGVKELIHKSYILLKEAQQNALARKQTYDRKLQREQARKDSLVAITGYSTAAGGIAASPIPFSDFALLIPTQIAMIIHISKIYGLEFNEESAKKVALGLAGVCATGFGLRLAAGNLLKFIPGVGSVAGGVVNATLASTGTAAMGKLYAAYLEENFDAILDGIFKFDIEKLKIFQETKKDSQSQP